MFIFISVEVISSKSLVDNVSKQSDEKDTSGKKMEYGHMKLKNKVPRFDNSAMIDGYACTLIGRCMNPIMHNMKTLLFMLPKIWKMEERVAGANLGFGRFQFDFENEKDIQEVMKMEPFHFDHW